jgi:hypothetical protein
MNSCLYSGFIGDAMSYSLDEFLGPLQDQSIKIISAAAS